MTTSNQDMVVCGDPKKEELKPLIPKVPKSQKATSVAASGSVKFSETGSI